MEEWNLCPQLHTIEVLDGDEWLPLHIHRARQILAAPLSRTTPIDTPDGPLFKCHGTWTKETAARAEAIAEVGSDAWRAALGPHEEALLTADGHFANSALWCCCARTAPAGSWVRFERWSQTGREAHGYLCPKCRRVAQSG